MNNNLIKLNNVDPEDLSDVLIKIQKSFNIQLDNEGLKDINSVDGLCDMIASKISHEREETCSTQHAFYLLRNAIAAVIGVDKCDITPQTRLCKILPKENRLQLIAGIENELGFKTNLLQPKQWILTIFGLTLVGSFILCFFNLPVGIAGLLSSAISLKLAGKFGKEIHLKTVGDLANKLARESNLRSRRNNCQANKNEIEQKVKEFFVNDLGLEPIMLTRKSRF
jgi:hypothetical protein